MNLAAEHRERLRREIFSVRGANVGCWKMQYLVWITTLLLHTSKFDVQVCGCEGAVSIKPTSWSQNCKQRRWCMINKTLCLGLLSQSTTGKNSLGTKGFCFVFHQFPDNMTPGLVPFSHRLRGTCFLLQMGNIASFYSPVLSLPDSSLLLRRFYFLNREAQTVRDLASDDVVWCLNAF